MNKNLLRSKFLKIRQQQNKAIAAQKNQVIQIVLEDQMEFKKAKNILVYVSKKDEVDTHHLIKKYLTKKRLVVPKVNKKQKKMLLYKLERWSDLKLGQFKILEPISKNKVQPSAIELAIVPGLIFALNGHRIGYGGGFFDRLLKKMRCPKIGLAFDFQIVDKIRNHHYDVAVDKIVTEKRVIECKE